MSYKRVRAACAAAVAALLTLTFGMGTSTASASSVECRESLVPVSLTEGGASDQQHVFVKLCMPGGSKPSVVQVVVPGATYGNRYWDFPDPRDAKSTRYNYVAAATGAGFATLSLDRIGIGQSSHPASELVGLDANAWVVQQVVHALRAGAINGPGESKPSFERVVLVGHSFGSITSTMTATTYQDVDGVVLTGFSHYMPGPAGAAPGGVYFWPVTLDPKFGPLSYDPGYLTSPPGTRYDGVYAPAPADPEVVALDEQLKETMTERELQDVQPYRAGQLDIRVPVLLVIGDLDKHFCAEGVCQDSDTLVAKEGPRLGTRVPSVDGYILRGAGHMLNMDFNAEEYFDVVQSWISGKFGR